VIGHVYTFAADPSDAGRVARGNVAADAAAKQHRKSWGAEDFEQEAGIKAVQLRRLHCFFATCTQNVFEQDNPQRARLERGDVSE
jgi:hypothetical protein